jgi:Domain of unknown function (DUF4258)
VLVLTRHARDNIVRDAIDQAWIETTVRQPTVLMVDPHDPTLSRAWRRIPERGGRVLRVVFRPAGADIVVVTVFFDRGARRWLP